MQRTYGWLAVLVAVGAMGCDGERIVTDGGPGGDSGPIVEVDAGPGTDSGPGCVDGDGDGYGAGCALGADCDDTNPAVSPAATDVCNGTDDDCDGTVDEDSGAPSCRLTDGVCAGAIQRCGPDGFLECEAIDYGSDYEADEAACDGLDNDCDGTTDEGCTCTDGMTQACGSDVGLCMEGIQTCADSAWGPCEGDTGPMGEVCDGADNDCDGSSDEVTDLVAPPCPLQLGVCSGRVRACGGVAGWIACSGIASYGGDYQVTETLCDGLDNDCDGVTDNGCACVTGATQPCGTDIGACMAGTQPCTAGSWGACAGETAPVPETCDGVDQNCDGMVDNGVVAPACALTVGICAGSTRPCAGASGFGACTATQYGPSYQATETTCDGQDNDCDGTTDEGCTCVGGATQACGITTGVCERGTQTCAAGAWGACTGGVEPSPELCNGMDDDCNGSSDDALTAPPCALSMGVCAGSTQTCGGVSGWAACGATSYGPRYIVSEDGSTDETVCDGLDNDCDGTADEGCTSGPIVSTIEDTVLPDLYNRHLVFLANLDGNWDVVLRNVATAETFRLTTTPASEDAPRVYGNHVVYTRGTAAAQRVYLYDLTDGSETALTTRQSSSPTIYGGTVAWEEWDGSQWDIYLYDIEMGSTTNLFVGGTTSNEGAPSLRGNRIAYVSDVTGNWLTHVIDFGVTTPVPVAQTPASITAAGQGAPVLDYVSVGWTDGRFVTSTTPNNTTDDWDIYGAPFNASGTLSVYPGENVISGPTNAQLLRDVDGALFVWNDYRNGNWDPGVGGFTGGSLLLSTHSGHQGDPTISGDLVMWEDNRLGSFDIYGSSVSSGALADPGDLVINELLADPAAGADVNRDGVADTTQDELVEIINVTGIAIDLSGLTVSDAVSVRHTFPAGTVLPALGSIVVFGGGTVSGAVFGGAQLQIASGGQLGLNNTGDTVTLRRGTTVIDTITYGAAGGNDDALVRTPELSSGTTLTRHSMMAGSGGTRFSPGTSVRGFAF